MYYRKGSKDPMSVVETNDNDIIWLKIDQKLLYFILFYFFFFFFCNLYIPPACSKFMQDRDFDFFEEVEVGL